MTSQVHRRRPVDDDGGCDGRVVYADSIHYQQLVLECVITSVTQKNEYCIVHILRNIHIDVPPSEYGIESSRKIRLLYRFYI